MKYCAANECSQRIRTRIPMCKAHWSRVPEDIRDRIQWALDGDDEVELQAALNEADSYTSP